jgi:hypothetical protein
VINLIVVLIGLALLLILTLRKINVAVARPGQRGLHHRFQRPSCSSDAER